MSRIISRITLLSALLATAACSQPAATVDLRGGEFFGRGGSGHAARSYSSVKTDAFRESASNYKPYEPAPVYTNVPQKTEQTASISSIGVSDLPPPAAVKSSEPAPVKAAAPAASKPVATAAPAKLNPWTKKPRESAMNDEETETIIHRPEPQKTIAAKPEKFARAAGANSYMWPVSSHKVVSGFGPKGAGKANDGINIASSEGEPVWAASDGEVVYVGNELSSYGNMVLIKHAGSKTTTYAHLNRATVDKYDRVKQGDIIGYVGSTGNVKSSQLHFAIRDGKEPVDPKKFLSTSLAGL